MKKEDKEKVISSLVEKIQERNQFYLTDIGELNAEDTTALRKACYKNEVELLVVKNKLLKKALERLEINDEAIMDILVGPTSMMFSAQAKAPAKLIKEFRKKSKKPVLKGAYIDTAVYVGDDQIDALNSLKSKEDLIGDVLTLLQSPIQNLISGLKSGEQKFMGVLKTLGSAEEAQEGTVENSAE